jgi:hypothetical protein
MLYSREQLKNIERQKANIKRNIQITNLRSKGIQDILVDGQIPHELINESIRNTNDLENDKFALQAELNKLTSNILKTGDIYSLQQRLESEGLTKFFIENYPRIVAESKMYRSPTTNNVLMITKKLFKKHLKELNYNSSDVDSVMNTLDHLTSMLTSQNDPNLKDNLNKIDTIRQVAGKVDDIEVFMKSLFGVDDYLEYLEADPIDALSHVSRTAIENSFLKSTQNSKTTSFDPNLPSDPYELTKMQITQFSKRADASIDGLAKEISKRLNVNVRSLLTNVTSKEDLLKVAFERIDKQRESDNLQNKQKKSTIDESFALLEELSHKLEDPNIQFGTVQKIASTLRSMGYVYKQQKLKDWVGTLLDFCNDALTDIENNNAHLMRKPGLAVSPVAKVAKVAKGTPVAPVSPVAKVTPSAPVAPVAPVALAPIPPEQLLKQDWLKVINTADMNELKQIAGFYNRQYGISIYKNTDTKEQLRTKLDNELQSLLSTHYSGGSSKKKKPVTSKIPKRAP